MSSEDFGETTRVILDLDEDDIRDFRKAVEERLSWALDGRMAIPHGGGSLEGRAIGEICRGWMESLMFVRQRQKHARKEGRER